MERQLAAILYADVAGYSRLTGHDEEETHRKLDAGLNLLADVIAAHGGQKIHEAGDAILAEFRSVTAAVDSAVDFQRQMLTRNAELAEDERLEFRVGINLGEVIHDRDDIYGDGVNLAARIQDLAEPGGVCISGTVYEQVTGKVDQTFDDLGHRKVKNIAQSIRVYRARLSDMLPGAEDQPSFDFDSHTIDRSSLITGQCLCGDIRYEVSQPAAGTGVCHCRMCQRAIGASLDAWTAFPAEAVRFMNGKPKYYTSSLIAERGFCANCGSSLLARYYAPEESEFLIIMTACLDNPENFAPAWHGCIESR
ncbi:MAG: adenylate/guanylate cyclase domain-containing protein, partial [Gammaproteobacteria bacterium]